MIHDEFYWISQINKASVLSNSEEKLLDEATAKLAARGIVAVEKEAEIDPAKRVKKYIAYEPMVIAATGPEVTILHAGRSSQDILSTMRVAILREQTLDLCCALDAVITKLLELAREHRNTVVPNYTNGVAAQPNSYAHYLLGFVASFLRDRERLNQCLLRYNECPMGATVLNGTGWPLNRNRMAELLGFDRPRINAFDCTCETPVDFALEVSSIAASIGVHAGSMINDIMVQYAQSRPWIILQEGGENTYVSSAMPQKLDGKSVAKHGRMTKTCISMLERFLKVLNALRINPERALEELNSDWTASQEIADRLMRVHGLPFRIGHHMASRMVSWARANNVLPKAFPYAEMQRIYKEEIAEEYPEGPAELPMSEAEFQEALDPRKIIAGRKTAGSAAPKEVEEMLEQFSAKLAGEISQTEALRKQVGKAMDQLESAFSAFL